MRLLLSLFIAATLATQVHALAPIDFKPLQTDNIAGCPQAATGTATYALNKALTGTSSAAIDLGLYGCFFFSVTTNANAVQVWTGPTSNTATAAQLLGTATSGNYATTKQARYIWFQTIPNPGVPFATNQAYTTPTTASVWYYTPTGAAIGGGSSGGTTSLTPNAGTPSSPFYVNSNGFNALSFTVATGLTPSADTAISLTWAAGVSTAATSPIFAEINCSGATGVNYIITSSATAPAGWVANSALAGYQLCGQISQIPLEANPGNTPHLHVVASSLTGTAASIGISTKQRN